MLGWAISTVRRWRGVAKNDSRLFRPVQILNVHQVERRKGVLAIQLKTSDGPATALQAVELGTLREEVAKVSLLLFLAVAAVRGSRSGWSHLPSAAAHPARQLLLGRCGDAAMRMARERQ